MSEDNREKVSIPFIMESMDSHNRRMLVALLSVCLTFILTIVIFVVGYTVREKNWLDTIQRMGATDGVHQQSDPGTDP